MTSRLGSHKAWSVAHLHTHFRITCIQIATIKLAIKATASHRLHRGCLVVWLAVGIIIMQLCWPGHFGHLADRPFAMAFSSRHEYLLIERAFPLFISRHAIWIMAPNCTVFNSGCVVDEIETVPAVTFRREREGEKEWERQTPGCM